MRQPPAPPAQAPSSDPRLSVEERYGTLSGYYMQRLSAVNAMLEKKLILPEDAFAEFSRGVQQASNLTKRLDLGEEIGNDD